MKKILFLLILILITGKYIGSELLAQGCVAIRSTGGYCTMQHTDDSKWMLTVNNRYFKSFRHFVGKEEQEQRQKLGTEVVNHQYALDLALTRQINERWSVLLDMPVVANSRSSLYEHKNVGRYSTHSFGVGDMRLAVFSWIIDPKKHSKGNIQAGLGIKLPTGNYNYMDYFKLTDSTHVLGPVDQSIQPGDGGTGLTLELNSFYRLSHVISFYGNFYYLSNPREQNGVSTARGSAPTRGQILEGSEVMSVPDQYMARAGITARANIVDFSAGLRIEAIPVYDLIGGSNGFRRPGRILTVEPGANVTLGKVNVYAFVPVALVRNRTQSVPDKITTELTGIYKHGDAAFADYVVSIGASFRF